jgi:hypothetical protein
MMTILPNRQAQRQRSTLVFRRWAVRISARIQAIPADVCRGFLQSLQPNTGIIPLLSHARFLAHLPSCPSPCVPTHRERRETSHITFASCGSWPWKRLTQPDAFRNISRVVLPCGVVSPLPRLSPQDGATPIVGWPRYGGRQQRTRHVVLTRDPLSQESGDPFAERS